jgi:Na+-transporting methylmalonyl-CoA/oxaloacetate decarboxylase gamma subunit
LNGDFSTGLMVSLIGLTITFIALGVFIGVIYLLKALFPYKAKAEEGEEEGEGDGGSEGPAMMESADEEVVAAITAVTYLHGHTASSSIPSRNPIWTSK